MVSKGLIRQKIKRYIELLNQGDIDGIIGLFARDAVLEDPVGTDPYVGIAAVEQFYRSSLKRVKVSARQTGPVRTTSSSEGAVPLRLYLLSGERSMVVEPIDIMRFNEAGEIVAMRSFWSPEHNYKTS